MFTWLWRERWYLLTGGVVLFVLLGSHYVHDYVDEENKPAWLTAVTDTVVDVSDWVRYWGSSLPDCSDSEVVASVEDLARQLVFNAMPYNIEQPFHLDKIEVVAVTERETASDGHLCRGHLEAPHLARSGRQYRVGVIQYTIAEDETDRHMYYVEAQLESVNLLQWAD